MNPPRVPADPTPTVAHGGTFVRPGALVWSRPDTSPGACSDSGVIEDALAAAAKDHDRVTDLLDQLRRARLWLPLPDGGPVTDGSAVLLPTVTYLGAEFVPAFTSAERLSHWQQDDPRHIVVPAAELARLLPPEMGIALNPGAEASVPIYPEGIGHLAAVGSGEVRVGHPPADPVALLGEVRAALRAVPAVRRASRAWLTVPRRGEGLIISVTLDDPANAAAHDAVIEAIERAAALVPHQFPIDVTFPGEGAPDQVDEWVAAYAEPFYLA
jgi:hypothetical protein